MQNLQLGDYKGGRDTLQAALQMQYSPLENVQAAARAFGQQGMAGASAMKGKRFDAQAQREAATIKNERDVAAALLATTAAKEMAADKNQTARDINKNTIEYNKSALNKKEEDRIKTLKSKNLGALLALRTTFKAVRDSLGEDSEYYKHVADTLSLLDELEKSDDPDSVFSSLNNINQNPAMVIKQARLQREAEKLQADRARKAITGTDKDQTGAQSGLTDSDAAGEAGYVPDGQTYTNEEDENQDV
jgi:hypothetical protein